MRDVIVIGSSFAGLTVALQLGWSETLCESSSFAIGDGGMAGIGGHQSLISPDFIQPIEAVA